MSNLQPFELRDFRQGRITPDRVSESLVPANSVSYSRNVNFDEIIGKAKVRKGTTLVGSAVASGKAPLGLGEFVGKANSPNYLMSVFKGASNATAYYFNGSSWAATNKTSLSNSAINHFATLGGSVFMTNSTDGMFDATDHTFGTTNSISSASVVPSYVFRSGARLICAGDPTYPSRVWFSSIIDPTSSPFITWNTNQSTGDWIDINPDDGGQITGFAESSTFTLVFKGNGMYRLDTVNKSATPKNIFNIGAVSQEGIVSCQGIVYFFSGIDIRQTDGGFPEQISRTGVQDVIDAIPQSNWASVSGGTDGLNVYFSVGTVTLNSGRDDAVTLTNCVLKFSPRDQSWSIHTYANLFNFFTLYTDSTNGRVMRGADTTGQVQSINVGTTDNGTAINYEMLTQDIEFGNRAHWKKVANKIVVYTKNGQDSSLSCLQNGEPKNIPIELSKRVNIGRDINIEGNYFNFRWFGQSANNEPIFEGLYLEDITDTGTSNG